MIFQGRIFNIERHGLVDGPGIRTVVFFKGCPLKCHWCHNPESQSISDEIMYAEDQCTGCGTCISVCPHKAISINSITGKRCYLPEQCERCGACITVCPSRALEMAGQDIEVETLIKEIVKSAAFHRRSGGGITLSGGEPLLQPDFCKALLTECRNEGVHTALDTCGYAPWRVVSDLLPLVDLFLYDVKHIDEKKHQVGTGVSNARILRNLEKLAACSREGHPEITVRIPVIPGFNDTLDEVIAILDFLKPLQTIRHLELLPFHHYGESKYKKLQKDYELEASPRCDPEFLDACAALVKERGFEVDLGE